MNTNKTLADFLDDLTPTEREVVMKSTLKDWIDAFVAVVQAPDFWEGIRQAFIAGVIDGIKDFEDDQY